MNKKLQKLFFAGALLTGVAGVSVSCKDYQADLNSTNSKIDVVAKTAETNKTALNKLSESLKDGRIIKTITTAENGDVTFTFVEGEPVVLPAARGAKGEKGDKGETGAKGDKGETGAAGTVVTAEEDGFWYLDGTKTDKPWKSTSVYYKPGEGDNAGKWVKVTVTPGVETPVEEVTDMPCGGGSNGITVVYNKETGSLELSNVEGVEGTVKLNTSGLSTLRAHVGLKTNEGDSYLYHSVRVFKTQTLKIKTIALGSNKVADADTKSTTSEEYNTLLNSSGLFKFEVNPFNSTLSEYTSFVAVPRKITITRDLLMADGDDVTDGSRQPNPEPDGTDTPRPEEPETPGVVPPVEDPVEPKDPEENPVAPVEDLGIRIFKLKNVEAGIATFTYNGPAFAELGSFEDENNSFDGIVYQLYIGGENNNRPVVSPIWAVRSEAAVNADYRIIATKEQSAKRYNGDAKYADRGVDTTYIYRNLVDDVDPYCQKNKTKINNNDEITAASTKEEAEAIISKSCDAILPLTESVDLSTLVTLADFVQKDTTTNPCTEEFLKNNNVVLTYEKMEDFFIGKDPLKDEQSRYCQLDGSTVKVAPMDGVDHPAAAIGKTPLIRVVAKSGDKVLAYSYIKLLIVDNVEREPVGPRVKSDTLVQIPVVTLNGEKVTDGVTAEDITNYVIKSDVDNYNSILNKYNLTSEQFYEMFKDSNIDYSYEGLGDAAGASTEKEWSHPTPANGNQAFLSHTIKGLTADMVNEAKTKEPAELVVVAKMKRKVWQDGELSELVIKFKVPVKK